MAQPTKIKKKMKPFGKILLSALIVIGKKKAHPEPDLRPEFNDNNADWK